MKAIRFSVLVLLFVLALPIFARDFTYTPVGNIAVYPHTPEAKNVIVAWYGSADEIYAIYLNGQFKTIQRFHQWPTIPSSMDGNTYWRYSNSAGGLKYGWGIYRIDNIPSHILNRPDNELAPYIWNNVPRSEYLLQPGMQSMRAKRAGINRRIRRATTAAEREREEARLKKLDKRIEKKLRRAKKDSK
jgi:hypothetical protein